MTNGVKYTQTGRVFLSVEMKPKTDDILFSVLDTGIGIADSDKKVIFTEFGRAFAVRDIEGTGLGLALSKKLIIAHGGRIGFESELGKGSLFWFSLPREEPTRTDRLPSDGEPSD
jgi:two-component system sensor histidine kinase TorS